ncbi:MAG: hypothetical protein ACM30I_14715 [Gemmatimonas sp.]
MSAPQPQKGEAFVRNRRNRNRAMLVVLLALVVIFYVLTWVKIAGGAA